jgi:GDP-L-fucose synthase
MNKNSKIFIAGSAGMVGSAIVRNLLRKNYRNFLGSWHSQMPDPSIYQPLNRSVDLTKDLKLFQIDLTVQDQVASFFEREKPDYVFLAAAIVGGIHANNAYPADFIHNNLTIQGNIIHSAYQFGTKRLLFLGSSCIYPKEARQPMKEEYLLTGPLEPTNEPYAIAKIAGVKMCEAFNRQYGTQFIAIMPTNLYGPNDNFDLKTSHVIPALINKFYNAKQSGAKEVVVWGTGIPRREFLHVDDLADLSVFVMELQDEIVRKNFLSYPDPCFLNVGTGKDLTIAQLAGLVKYAVGFSGNIVFDPSKPDGTPRKLLDISRLRALGWEPGIELKKGIVESCKWYRGTR